MFSFRNLIGKNNGTRTSTITKATRPVVEAVERRDYFAGIGMETNTFDTDAGRLSTVMFSAGNDANVISVEAGTRKGDQYVVIKETVKMGKSSIVVSNVYYGNWINIGFDLKGGNDTFNIKTNGTLVCWVNGKMTPVGITVIGGAGNDKVVTNVSMTQIVGEYGYLVSNVYVYVDGGTGNDDLRDGYNGYGDAANGTYIGGDGNDVLRGGRGDNTLFGGNGNDALYGGSGYTAFDGGAGTDSHIGGSGFNRFYISEGYGYYEGGLNGNVFNFTGERQYNEYYGYPVGTYTGKIVGKGTYNTVNYIGNDLEVGWVVTNVQYVYKMDFDPSTGGKG